MSSYDVGRGVFWTPGKGGYVPNQAIGNESPDTAAYGENVIFEGRDISRAARKPLDTGYTGVNSTLGYNIVLVAGNAVANAAAGTLLTDCVPFQHVLINSKLYCFLRINSNTQCVLSPTPAENYTGAPVLVPNLHALGDGRRASLLAGNVVEYNQGLFVVGRGVLKVDGASISASMTATSTPKIAYPVTNTTYDSRPCGFTAPTAPTIVSVAGGTKAMPAEIRSIKVSKKRSGEFGYGPACDAVLVDMSAAIGRMARITFAAYDASEGQNRWIVWVTKDETSSSQGGPWYEYGEVDSNGGTVDIEWRSGELGANYVEDNARKPDPATCVAAAGDVVMWGGCLGYDSTGAYTIPGDIVEVSLPTNVEGYPSSAYTSTTSGEDVISIKVGKVQMFTLTPSTVQVALLTQSSREPLALYPFIQSGCVHQYNACLGSDIFVVFTDGRLFAFADQSLAQDPVLFRLAEDVAALLQDLPAARVFIGFDPAYNHFVVFCSNYRLGAGGGWQSMALSFDVRLGRTNTPVILGDGTTDFTVTGCATIGNHLEFITSAGAIWRWEKGSGTVTGFLASPFTNWGTNMARTTVRKVVVVGRINGSVGLVKDLDETTVTMTTLSGVPIKTLSNGTYVRKRFQVWSPNYQGNTVAVRADFSVESGTRIIESVEVGAVKRQGAEN